MARKKKKKKNCNSTRVRKQIKNLELRLVNNEKAMEEGPTKKKWTEHDIVNITPLTPTQEEMFHSFFQNQHICAYGSSGTGKSFIGLYLAIAEVIRKESDVSRVIIVRSTVQLRELGHMPGDLEEKISFYETPYKDIMANLFGRPSTYNDMKNAGLIQFVPTTFIRGLTWNNAVVIIDEFQNMTLSEIDSVMTRIGQHTRLILCGDIKYQCDLKREQTSAQHLIKITKNIKDFSVIQFSTNDIVRSKFVKSWITTREDLNI